MHLHWSELELGLVKRGGLGMGGGRLGDGRLEIEKVLEPELELELVLSLEMERQATPD